MLSAPFIVAQSDLLMAIPRYAAEVPSCRPDRDFPLPFAISPFTVKIYSINAAGSEGNQMAEDGATKPGVGRERREFLTSKRNLK